MNVNYQEPDPAIASAFPYALADNDRNRMVFSSGYRAGRDAARKEAEAEVEWGVALPGESGFGTPDRATAESFVRDYPEEEYSLVHRLVGPWTVVPEGEQP